MITSTHRGHGHCLAKGLGTARDVRRADGPGQRHEPRARRLDAHRRSDARDLRRQRHRRRRPADRRRRGDGVQLRADGGVAVAFFGDGAVAQGAFHEAVNLAAVWRLPTVFWCENNGYAEFSPAAAQHAVSLERRAAGYGVDYLAVDGNDVVAVRGGDGGVRRRRSAPARPGVVEATTYRWHGHYEGDPQRYRTAASSTSGRQRDPIVVHARRLESVGVDEDEIASLEASVDQELDEALSRARAASAPMWRRWRLRRSVPGRRSRTRPAVRGRPDRSARWTRSTTRSRSSSSDDRVFVAGIDVGEGGNVFGLTRGLRDRFGDRVRDTPISETAIVGLGVGAAMAGMRPVVEIMYLDFVGVCLDQLLNQAAKLPFMTGGDAADGADGPHAVRRRQVLGQPALPEPRGAARPHPRPDGGDADDPGRHLRVAAGGDPGPEPGGVHREPPDLRHEGAPPAGITSCRSASRPSSGRAPTSRWCRCRGWCTNASRRPRRSPTTGSRSR